MEHNDNRYESFFYMGNYKTNKINVHYFLHALLYNDFDFNRIAHIYNFMIHHGYIKNYNDICIIYTLYEDTNYFKHVDKVTIIQHKNHNRDSNMKIPLKMNYTNFVIN